MEDNVSPSFKRLADGKALVITLPEVGQYSHGIHTFYWTLSSTSPAPNWGSNWQGLQCWQKAMVLELWREHKVNDIQVHVGNLHSSDVPVDGCRITLRFKEPITNDGVPAVGEVLKKHILAACK